MKQLAHILSYPLSVIFYLLFGLLLLLFDPIQRICLNVFGYKALDTKALSSGVLDLHWLDSNKETLAERLLAAGLGCSGRAGELLPEPAF